MSQLLSLIDAVRAGDDARVAAQLKDWPGPPISGLRDPDGQTLLNLAAQYGHQPVFERLVQQHAVDPNVPDKLGMTAAHHVAMFGHAHMVESLKAAGANLGLKDQSGLTPAQVAAVSAQASLRSLYASDTPSTLKALVQAGAPVPRSVGDWPPPGRGRGSMTADRVKACQDQVDRVATELAMADLGKNRKGGASSTQIDRLRCAVSLKPFALQGPDRPVLLPAGAARAAADPLRKVLEQLDVSRFMVSADEAKKILESDKPRNPFQRTDISRTDADAFLRSQAFRQGDADRLGEIRSMVNAYLDARSPAAQTGKGLHYTDVLKAVDAHFLSGASPAGAPRAPAGPPH